MNKKIRAIEVLNEMANNESYRPTVKYKEMTYTYHYDIGDYTNDFNSEYGIFSGWALNLMLNDEVEILEDTTEEIEEIGEFVDLIGMDENEEEKKAIEIIKFLQHKCMQENGIGMMTIYRVDEIANAIETILNLIEKQQKEIEELQAINEKEKE